MADDETPPTFEPFDVVWGQTVILQELILQLMQSGALQVERAQRLFDSALQRTMKTGQPGSTRFVKHVHDSWSAIKCAGCFHSSVPANRRQGATLRAWLGARTKA